MNIQSSLKVLAALTCGAGCCLGQPVAGHSMAAALPADRGISGQPYGNPAPAVGTSSAGSTDGTATAETPATGGEPSGISITRLIATLQPIDAGGASGAAIFQEGDGGLKISLELHDLKPNSSFTIVLHMQAGPPQTDPTAPRHYPQPLESKVSDARGMFKGTITAKGFTLTSGERPVLNRGIGLHADGKIVAVGTISADPPGTAPRP